MKYGELPIVLTVLLPARGILDTEPWREKLHFNKWHYDLQFKRKENKLRKA